MYMLAPPRFSAEAQELMAAAFKSTLTQQQHEALL